MFALSLSGIGMIGGSIFISASLTFWFGVKLIRDGSTNIESGTIVSVRHLPFRSFLVIIIKIISRQDSKPNNELNICVIGMLCQWEPLILLEPRIHVIQK